MQRLFLILACGLLIGAGNSFAADIAVSIATFQFDPKEVVLQAGDRLVVVNNDGTNHSITADAADGATPAFDTGLFGQGEERTLDAPPPGTYGFHCMRHPSMKGTLIVE